MRLRLLLVLLFVTIFLKAYTTHSSFVSSHGCAPSVPPPIPGSSIPTPATPGSLLINEVLSLPGSRWNCSEPNGTFSINNDSWVELHNPQSQPNNLYTAHASFDTGPNTFSSYIPLGSVIAPHGYLVLFPAIFSGSLITKAHLRLVISGIIIDQVNVPSLSIDQSYARIPIGSNSWQITDIPTLGASNNTSLMSLPNPQSSPQVNPQHSPQVNPTTSSSSNQVPNDSGYLTPTIAPITDSRSAWKNLQVPTSVTITTPTTKSTIAISSTFSSPMSDGWDAQKRIILTILTIVLAMMLMLCWRLFSIHS